jgi:ribosomal-protein-alanine N-acetyltransferase
MPEAHPMLIRALTDTDALAIATWRYPGRESTYDVDTIVSADQGYWAVEDSGELVGYCCFGAEARVPGVAAEPDALDVGYGIRPDLVGRGLGRTFVGAILAFGVDEFAPRRLRLLILDWNDRSRKVAEALGFTEERIVPSTEGMFRVMVRAASAGQ